MKRPIILAALLGSLFACGILAAIFFADPDYCGWPTVTRCRLCNHRVWVWQDHERRDGNSFGVHGAGVWGQTSAIVHSACKGTPQIDVQLSVAATTTPHR